MAKLAKERWKKISIPERFNTNSHYQISNYGRIRNLLKDGSFHIKKAVLYKHNILYRFSFSKGLNGGVAKVWHVKASRLVGKYFNKSYFERCYVIHKDYNRQNNYFRNLLCLSMSEGRSYMAKRRISAVEQELIVPPIDTAQQVISESHKVEVDDNYFKTLPDFPHYEINRFGVIRRRKPPFVGRVMKPRKHPDQFYFVELRNPLKQRKTIYIHKAVATVWNINLEPEENKVVVHLDGDTLNNVSDNLEWMSHSGALKLQFKHKKRDNRKSWKTRKKLYGNGFKSKGKKRQSV